MTKLAVIIAASILLMSCGPSSPSMKPELRSFCSGVENYLNGFREMLKARAQIDGDDTRRVNAASIPEPPAAASPDVRRLYDLLREYQKAWDRIEVGTQATQDSLNALNDWTNLSHQVNARLPLACPNLLSPN